MFNIFIPLLQKKKKNNENIKYKGTIYSMKCFKVCALYLCIRNRLNKQYTQSVRITVAFHLENKIKMKKTATASKKMCIAKSIV